MRNASIVLGTTIVLALAGVSHAQRPAGITREMIATALPVEGAPLAVPGPYKVESRTRLRLAGSCGLSPGGSHSVPGQRHAAADGLGQRRLRDQQHSLRRLPDDDRIARLRRDGDGRRAGRRPGGRSTADNLRKAIDWAEAENKRAGSPLNGKIALDRVAVMGQSCGGFLSLELGADPRVDTIGVFNSGAQGDNIARLAALHGPVLLINGHERDFLMASSKATFDAIEKLPAFYGARHGAGHTATVDHPGGGEWANVASNWLRWQFKGDKQAAKMFVGKDCSLCTNSNWDTASKHLQ